MVKKKTTSSMVYDTYILSQKMLGVLQNIDNNYKIMLSNINSLNKELKALSLKIDSSNLTPVSNIKNTDLNKMVSVEAFDSTNVKNKTPPIVKKKSTKPATKPKHPGLKSEANINIPTQKAAQQNVVNFDSNDKNKKEDNKFVNFEEERAPSTNAASSSVNKIVVEQKIQFNNGDAVALASVKITDANNKTKKIRTTPAGKWNSKLESGVYKVNVSKRPTSTHQGINSDYTIIVPGDYLGARYNLDTFIIEQ